MTILKVGQLIADRYEVIAFVGEGGMQEVYRAGDTSLGREVALKTPKNDSAKKRFLRSAAMSAKVTHPNVAKTFDYLEHDNRQYLIEEFIVGSDLGERLEAFFLRLDPHLCAHVLHHLAKGLAAVHREKVTHRDLKPKNIMVSGDCDLSLLKITDFGIAKMAAAEIEENVGKGDATLFSRTVVGAIPYMAPEVLRNRDDVTTSADMWSIGAIMYSLLIGDLPFGSGITAVQAVLAAKGPPDRPASLTVSSQFRPLTNDLWDLITKCLQVDPVHRITAEQLVVACNTLCYSTTPRILGTIGRYPIGSGSYGFIHRDDGEDNAFFHRDSFWGTAKPVVGDRVCFAQFPGDPAPRAHPVLHLRPLIVPQ